MWDLVTAYCLAIKTLIKNAENPNRAQLAIGAVADYGQKEGVSPLIGQFLETASSLKDEVRLSGKEYFTNELYSVQQHMGFVKHGFVLAMYALLRAKDKPIEAYFDWAMFQTTVLQGDTDTNCAIVGGVVGAYAGIDWIDAAKLKKLLECR